MSHASDGDSSHVLIDGIFDAPNALEILLTMLNAKIDYHERRSFSLRERFGETDHASLKRIEQLTATREEIKQAVTRAKEAGTRLQIRSVLELSHAQETVEQR